MAKPNNITPLRPNLTVTRRRGYSVFELNNSPTSTTTVAELLRLAYQDCLSRSRPDTRLQRRPPPA